MFVRVEHESAEAAADVDDAFTAGQLDLAADVIDLVDFGFVDIRRAFLPVTAGVHHQRLVEPVSVELRADGVVKAGVGPGLRDARIGKTPLMPAVSKAHQRIRIAFECAFEGSPERCCEIAIDIDFPVEAGLHEPDVPEQQDASICAWVPNDDGEYRRAFPVLVVRSIRELHAETSLDAVTERQHPVSYHSGEHFRPRCRKTKPGNFCIHSPR